MMTNYQKLWNISQSLGKRLLVLFLAILFLFSPILEVGASAASVNKSSQVEEGAPVPENAEQGKDKLPDKEVTSPTPEQSEPSEDPTEVVEPKPSTEPTKPEGEGEAAKPETPTPTESPVPAESEKKPYREDNKVFSADGVEIFRIGNSFAGHCFNISLKDSEGNYIKGAKFALKDIDGNVIEEWTTEAPSTELPDVNPVHTINITGEKELFLVQTASVDGMSLLADTELVYDPNINVTEAELHNKYVKFMVADENDAAINDVVAICYNSKNEEVFRGTMSADNIAAPNLRECENYTVLFENVPEEYVNAPIPVEINNNYDKNQMCVLVMKAVNSGDTEQPTPFPEVSPEPSPEVTPEPSPEVSPEPSPEVSPEVPEVSPEVSPEPSPESTPEPTPEPEAPVLSIETSVDYYKNSNEKVKLSSSQKIASVRFDGKEIEDIAYSINILTKKNLTFKNRYLNDLAEKQYTVTVTNAEGLESNPIILSIFPEKEINPIPSPNPDGNIELFDFHISAWKYNDPDEFLVMHDDKHVLEMPGVSEINPITKEQVIGMLPVSVFANVVEVEKGAIVTTLTTEAPSETPAEALAEAPSSAFDESTAIELPLTWDCVEEFADAKTEGVYHFVAALPEGYGFADGKNTFTILALLGADVSLDPPSMLWTSFYGKSLSNEITDAEKGNWRYGALEMWMYYNTTYDDNNRFIVYCMEAGRGQPGSGIYYNYPDKFNYNGGDIWFRDQGTFYNYQLNGIKAIIDCGYPMKTLSEPIVSYDQTAARACVQQTLRRWCSATGTPFNIGETSGYDYTYYTSYEGSRTEYMYTLLAQACIAAYGVTVSANSTDFYLSSSGSNYTGSVDITYSTSTCTGYDDYIFSKLSSMKTYEANLGSGSYNVSLVSHGYDWRTDRITFTIPKSGNAGRTFSFRANFKQGYTNSPLYLFGAETDTARQVMGGGHPSYLNGYSYQEKVADYVDITIRTPNENGTFDITKQSTDGSTTGFTGTKFSIYDNSYCSGSPVATTQISGSSNRTDGWITLPYGTYWIKETAASDGYQLNTTPKQIVVNSSTSNTTFYFSNTPKDKQFDIRKLCSDSSVSGNSYYSNLKGTRFEIYNNASCSGSPVRTAQISNGSNRTDGWIYLPYGTYWIKEVAAPPNYILNPTPLKVTINANSPTTIDFYNNPKKGTFDILKVSSDSSVNGNSNYSMVGAAFSVYDNQACTGTPVASDSITSGNRTAGWMKLPYGTYWVKETKAPKNFELNPTPLQITVNGSTNNVSFRFTDTPKLGTFRIQKTSSDPTLTDGNPSYSFSGAVFGIYKSTTFNDGNLVKKLTTNSNGYTNYVSLPYGTYYIKELTAPKNYELSSGYKSYTVNQWTNSATFEFADTPKILNGNLKLHKTIDSSYNDILTLDKKNIYKLTGTQFTVYKEEACTNSVGVLTVAADGYTNTLSLPQGKYWYKETKTPANFWWDSKVYSVDVTANTTKTVTAYNEPMYGTISLTKTSTCPDITNGNANYSLAGAKYGIYNHPDCSEAHLVKTMTTDASGHASANRLPVGRYVVKEISAPTGYYLDEVTVKNVTLDETHLDVSVSFADNIMNDPLTLEIHKVDSEGKHIPNTSLEGAEFTISYYDGYYTADNLPSAAKRSWVIKTVYVASADQYLAVYENPDCFVSGDPYYKDQFGEITMPLGTITVKETKAPNGFKIGDGVYTDMDGNKAENGLYVRQIVNDHSGTHLVGGFQIRMDEYVTKVSFDKHDDSGVALSGATLRVEDTDGNIVVPEWLTDGTPHLAEGKLTAGETYKLVEVSAPDGYTTSAPVTFIVDPMLSGVQTIVMTDALTKLSINKVDINGNPLPNAELRLHYNNQAGESTTTDWTSSEEAKVFEGCVVGQTVTLEEVSAPAGYAIAKDVVVTIEDTASQAITMKDKRVSVIVKSEDDSVIEVLPGCELNISNPSQAWVSGTESELMNGLRVENSYTVTTTKVPDGYVIPEKHDFTVIDDGKDQLEVIIVKPTVAAFSKQDSEGNLIPGANFTLTYIEGGSTHTVETWTSSNVPHYIKKLKVGREYTLTETKAPAGYTIAEPVKFTVKNVSTTQNVVMTDTPLVVKINKVDINGQPLNDALLQLTTLGGREIAQWSSTTSPKEIAGLAVGETYILNELAAPYGYAIAKPEKFTVSNVAEQTVTIKDKQVSIIIKDENDTPAPDCDMTLKDSDGRVVAKWLSGSEAYLTNQLIVGNEYTVSVIPPDGYISVPDYHFTVKDDGINQLEILRIVPTKIGFYKEDLKGNLLTGASIVLSDTSDNLISYWDTDGTVHYISKLTVGKTYKFMEVAAPNGYLIADPIEFTVKDVNGEQKITMKDAPTVINIQKVDINNQPLEGATLVLKDSSGRKVDSWTSSTTAHAVEKLNIGEKYTIVETAAPQGHGYARAMDTEFEVLGTPEAQEVTVKNKTISVIVKEKGGGPVAGVELNLKSGIISKDKWTSTTEAHPVEDLDVGDSYVVKIKVPDGYVSVPDYNFTIKNDGKNQLEIIYIEPTTLVVEKLKADLSPLSGADLRLTDSTGKVISQWKSNGSQKTFHKVTVGETYYLYEDAAPASHTKALPISYTIKDTTEVQYMKMINKAVSVSLRTSKTTEELPGAHLVLKDTEGKIIDEWDTTKGMPPHVVPGLEVGKDYVIIETKTPTGYTTAEEYHFNVPDDKTDQLEILINDPIQIKILKQDATGHNLPGATLCITDESGHEVTPEWVSTDKAQIISGLVVGKTYYLVEKSAPTGYAKATKIKFVPQDGNEAQVIIMKDIKISAVITPARQLDNFDVDTEHTEVFKEWAHTSKFVLEGNPYPDAEFSFSIGTPFPAGTELTLGDFTAFPVFYHYTSKGNETLIKFSDFERMGKDGEHPKNPGETTKNQYLLAADFSRIVAPKIDHNPITINYKNGTEPIVPIAGVTYTLIDPPVAKINAHDNIVNVEFWDGDFRLAGKKLYLTAALFMNGKAVCVPHSAEGSLSGVDGTWITGNEITFPFKPDAVPAVGSSTHELLLTGMKPGVYDIEWRLAATDDGPNVHDHELAWTDKGVYKVDPPVRPRLNTFVNTIDGVAFNDSRVMVQGVEHTVVFDVDTDQSTYTMHPGKQGSALAIYLPEVLINCSPDSTTKATAVFPASLPAGTYRIRFNINGSSDFDDDVQTFIIR